MRKRRTARRLIVLQTAAVGFAILLVIAKSLSAGSKEKEVQELELERCHQAIAQAGDSVVQFDDSLRRASSAERSVRVKECASENRSRSFDTAVVEQGHNIYLNYGCVFCHGQDAEGGEGGPSLIRSPRLMRDKKGETIGEVVMKGVPNTAMRAFPLKPDEMVALSAFLHSLQASVDDRLAHPPPLVIRGNPVAGRHYFKIKCSTCHSATADLLDIAARYPDPQSLQQTWLSPTRTLPVKVTVHAPEEAQVAGDLLQIDEFHVSLRVSDGTRRTFMRRGDSPNVEVHDPLAEHRAMLSGYSDADIHNVTAYLETLTSETKFHHEAGRSRLDSESRRPQAIGSRSTLSPEAIAHPMVGSWPTYSGDYTARRYSPLKKINQSNVSTLTLAWSARVTEGSNDTGAQPVIVRGEGKETAEASGAMIRGSILQFGGALYLSTPDNAWAIDARTGDILWHFHWKTRGGLRLGNRGLGMWGNYVFLATSDAYLVALARETGQERWRAEIGSFEEQYFASSAPIVVGHHVLIGAGNLLNAAGFLKSFDPENGKLQWVHYSVPMREGDPGLQTWKNLDAARHGGGQAWVPGAYDVDTHLYIYGTGNPTPAYMADPRGDKDALFTCSLLAVDVESGNLAWYYQTSPNDTHDWDSAQTPILANIQFAGQLRKVVMTAARNGYFFVLDRITGEHLLTSKFSVAANWAEQRLNAKGQPVRIPAKDYDVSGALVSNANSGAANWPPASYSPDYALFYVQAAESWAMYYKTYYPPGGAYSQGGKAELSVGADSYLKAINPATGAIVWAIRYPPRGLLDQDSGTTLGVIANGLLTTAGGLLFSGDSAGNLVARDPANGHPLWHTHLGKVSNAPESYMLDGQQYILVAGGDTIWAFELATE